MADSKIVELQLKFESAKSINDLKAAKKEVQAFFDARWVGTKRAAEAGELLAKVENKLSAARKVAMSDNALMMRSYFTLGESLRRSRGDVLALASAIGMDTKGLGGIFMGMVGTGGAVTAMIGGITAFIFAVNEAQKSIKDLKRELNELQGKGIENVMGDLAEAKGRKPAWYSGLGTGPRGGIGGLFSLWSRQDILKQAVDIAKAEKIIGDEGARIFNMEYEANKKNNEERSKGLEITKKETDELYKQVELSRQREGMGKNLFLGGSMFALGGAGGGFGRGFGRRPKPRTSGDIEGAASQNVAAGGGGGTYEEMFVDVPVNPTFDRIKTAAQDAGDAIKRSIGGALREALGLGDDLAGQIFSIVLNLGLDLISGGIGGAIGLGGGGGISSKSYGSSRNLSLNAPTIRLRGADLYVSWQKQSVIHSIGAR